jgi:hypothetical protein
MREPPDALLDASAVRLAVGVDHSPDVALGLPQLAQLRGERRILAGFPGRGGVQGAAPSLRPSQQVPRRAVLDDPADGRAD